MEQEPTGGSPPPESPPPGAPPPESPPPEAPPHAPAAAPVAWETAAPAAPVPGAAGFVYADVPNRIIALIIDLIILGIINVIITAVIGSAMGPQYDIEIDPADPFNPSVTTNFLSAGVTLIVSLAVGAAYWIYMWTVQRGSVGQKVLGMQVGNYPDGATLTQNQAIRRWVALGGPLPIVQTLNQLPVLGALIGLATFAYFVYLLYSTAKSPTKQGFHDKFANSVVVKAARVA
ncbi:MAG: RDD family protein [Chloroflexi bacterium]|nr:RDD family protein [Chloroflexota bacterium]